MLPALHPARPGGDPQTQATNLWAAGRRARKALEEPSPAPCRRLPPLTEEGVRPGELRPQSREQQRQQQREQHAGRRRRRLAGRAGGCGARGAGQAEESRGARAAVPGWCAGPGCLFAPFGRGEEQEARVPFLAPFGLPVTVFPAVPALWWMARGETEASAVS